MFCLGAAFSGEEGLSGAFGHVFEPFARADGATQGFGLAQGGISEGFVELLVQEGAEVSDAFQCRRHGDDVVVRPAKMRPRTRPGPVLGAFYQSCADRIERDVTQRGEQMLFVHRDRTEPPLPEVSRYPEPGVDIAGVVAMDVPEGPAQPILVARDGNDVGFVRIGQDAAVKLEAFPFTRYGTVPGRVRSISRDAVQDKDLGLVYVATIALERASVDADGRRYVLTPGLAATVDVRTGTRAIISYLLSPLQTSIAQAGRER